MSYTSFDRFVAWCRFRAAIGHIREGSRICDVGCGIDAAFLSYAQSRIGFGLGLDYQSLRPVAGLSAALVVCDISKGIPTSTGQFDHVVMLAVLEHLENPSPLLHDIFRVLRPGGSLIMTWPQAAIDPLLGFLHGIGVVSNEMESAKHQRRIPLAELINILRNIGFHEFKHQKFELGLNNLLVSLKPLA